MATIQSPPNSVWPNGLQTDSEGYVNFYPLGTNKVDISTITWPKGDKFVSPFIYQNDKLVGFIDTEALTTDSQTLIYLPYEHIEAEFSAINKGQLQIHAPKATTKKVSWEDSGKEDIPEAQFKYKGCTTIDNVKTVDANYKITDIVDGVWAEPLWDLEQGSNGNLNAGMFYNCDNLTSFNSDLPSLTNGYTMFQDCSNLTSFSSDLSSLTSSYRMFDNCSNLTSFSSDLSSLRNGTSMFSNCSNLTSFSSKLSSLTNGEYMFAYSSNFTSFSSDLSSLTRGTNMFLFCKLDAPSVKNIIDTINTSTAKLSLGVGCNNTEEDVNLFAQEVGYADMPSIFAALQAKGWTVTITCTGRPTTTYGLRRPSENTLPVFVKLEETEEYAAYTSLDDTKKFRLDYFHMTTGSTEGYTQYATLEEAIEALNIKPIERN